MGCLKERLYRSRYVAARSEFACFGRIFYSTPKGVVDRTIGLGISILGISTWGNLWIYLLANFAAAVVAAIVFNLINPPTQTTPIATDEPPYETPQ
jgi:hypothetical protein